jgi:hypothetical protein
MPGYRVMVDDNFHFMDEDERHEHGSFATGPEAIEACRALVDRSLAHLLAPGMTAAQLLEAYTAFGDDPFVIAPAGEAPLPFSAWDYARGRAAVLTASGGQTGAPK